MQPADEPRCGALGKLHWRLRLHAGAVQALRKVLGPVRWAPDGSARAPGVLGAAPASPSGMWVDQASPLPRWAFPGWRVEWSPGWLGSESCVTPQWARRGGPSRGAWRKWAGANVWAGPGLRGGIQLNFPCGSLLTVSSEPLPTSLRVFWGPRDVGPPSSLVQDHLPRA